MALKILLIEDNPDHIEITRRILQKTSQDYHMDSAMTAAEGLKKIFEEAYSVVICDYRLPDSTALDILKEMNAKNKETPFIVVTALGNEKVAVDMMKEGAYDYIVKDVLYGDTLDLMIKKVIDRYSVKKEKERLEKEVKRAYEELKETQNQLIQAEKLSAVGQLASGVAHEVRNPLGIILQGVNYLEKKMPVNEADVSETFVMLKDSVKRADKIINSLLDFSKASDLELKTEDINSILETSLNLLESRFKFESINVIIETKKDIPGVLADKNKLEQVFVNLLLNALQAMSAAGGKIFIRSYDKKLEETGNGIGRRKEDNFQPGEDVIIVEIEDTGSGISEENMKKIFDPFFTTKGPAGGAGLGLSVTHSIITMHKGLIDVKSQIGKGAKFIVTLHKVKG